MELDNYQKTAEHANELLAKLVKNEEDCAGEIVSLVSNERSMVDADIKRNEDSMTGLEMNMNNIQRNFLEIFSGKAEKKLNDALAKWRIFK